MFVQFYAGAAFNWRFRRIMTMKRPAFKLPIPVEQEKYEYCHTQRPNSHFAVVNIVLESPYVGIIEKDVRVTWTEQVENVPTDLLR